MITKKLFNEFISDFDIEEQTYEGSDDMQYRNYIEIPEYDENMIIYWLEKLKITLPFGKFVNVETILDNIEWKKENVIMVFSIFNSNNEENFSFTSNFEFPELIEIEEIIANYIKDLGVPFGEILYEDDYLFPEEKALNYNALDIDLENKF